MQRLITVLFAMLIMAAPVAAQDYKPLDINFGFGWAFPTTDFAAKNSNGWDTGWNGAVGVTFNINEYLGVQAEYMYTRMDGPSKQFLLSDAPVAAATGSGLIESNHQMHIGTFNLVYKAQGKDRPFGGYILGGGGIYHRIVQLTSPSVGYATICDPYWYVCYPTAVAVDTIIGDRSSNDFGINVGGGLTFGREGKFYVESRYHYVWGQTVTAPSGSPSGTPCLSGCNTNAAYFPLTFGFRW